MIINTLWIGEMLGPVHAACLRSFVRHGHDVLLHCFERPKDTPHGVKCYDARNLMQESEIIRHQETGSLALVSNIYRYRLIREGMGLYVDCDVYCVRPFEYSEYMFGYEFNDKFNSAILNMPKDCDLLNSLCEAAEDRYFIPPWLPEKKQRKDRLRRKLGFGKHVSIRPWGVIGPSLLTYHVKRLNLESKASPIDAYYSLHPDHMRMLWDEGARIEDLISRNTFGIHLYNSVIERFDWPLRPNTPLYEMVNS